MTQQALVGSESLGYHVRMRSLCDFSDSAAIQRRATLPWPFFEHLLSRLLKPLANARKHPESFHQGLRLLSIDGTQYSLRNTSEVLGLPRERHRNQHRSPAAFMKWSTAVLLELGTHQPLAVACSIAGSSREEGEIDIARRTLHALPAVGPSLLLGDRLYGCGSFILDVREACEQTHVLMRVRSNVRGKMQQMLRDGSALVQAHSEVRARAGKASEVLVREVRASITTPGKPAQIIRLWTTLLDAKKHPGQELVKIYAQQWEQEMFFRELKHHVASTGMLKAGSEQSAQAEFVAQILAASLVAQQRVQSAEPNPGPLTRYSARKVARMLEGFSVAEQLIGDQLEEKQRAKMIQRWLARVAREARIPPRRSRRCARGLRQPRSDWPVVRSRCKLDATVDIVHLAYE
jgi:hypothetical protein